MTIWQDLPLTFLRFVFSSLHTAFVYPLLTDLFRLLNVIDIQRDGLNTDARNSSTSTEMAFT